jgi:hypothetical protein
LTEVAPKRASTKVLLDQIAKANEEANPELFRLAMKMATGSGKTTVMAMLIAWQAVNAARKATKDFSRAFLIIAPGITIRDRLRVLRENPNARVLLASFSEPLAAELAKKVLVLAPDTGGVVPRITTASFQGIAGQMFQLEHGVRPRIASDAALRERLRAAAASAGLKGFSERFLLSEWTNVIDAA